MHLRIVTPVRIEFDEGGVDFVQADTPRGSIGILPSHAPLFTDLSEKGFVQYDQNGERKRSAVSGGVLHVLSDTITVMTQAKVFVAPR